MNIKFFKSKIIGQKTESGVFIGVYSNEAHAFYSVYLHNRLMWEKMRDLADSPVPLFGWKATELENETRDGFYVFPFVFRKDDLGEKDKRL